MVRVPWYFTMVKIQPQNTMVAKFYHGTSTMVATMVNIQPQNTMVAKFYHGTSTMVLYHGKYTAPKYHGSFTMVFFEEGALR